MAQSITLQTSDDDVIASDVLGRLSFAASNDSSGGDAILIGGSIYAMAEATFSAVSNPTSIIFATASSESATPKLKIESQGHFVPINNEVYDLGTSSYRFRSTYSENIETDKIVFISGSVPPVSVDNSAYNVNGELFFSGSGVALLPSGGLEKQILQKVNTTTNLLQWVDNYSTEVRVYVKNTTGSALTKGQAVYINSAQGDHPTIALAIASGESSSSKTLGLLYQNLAINEFGYVVSEGTLEGVDTSAAGQAGDLMYLSPTTPGGIVYGLANKPSAPNHLVFLGYVIVKQQNNGKVFVKVQNGFELEELHNVKINGVTNGQYLVYNSSSGVWANQTVNPGGGTTITNYADNRILTSDGTSTGINAESNLIFDGTTLTVSGNIGIGTSDALRKLTITGGGFAFVDSGGAARAIHWGNTDNIFPLLISGTATSGNCYFAFNTNTFGNAGTERMRIDSAGNVGIGSTSPTTLLHILGTGEGIHSGRVGGQRPHLRLQHANGTVASRTISANGNYVGQVSFEGYNGTSYMEHTGIFGIVNGTVTTTSIPTDLVFSAGSSGNTASNERMRITSAGNVGIGLTPSFKLDVYNGNIRSGYANNSALLVTANSTASTGAAIAIQQTTGEGWTAIFADFEPYAEWGFYHDNPNNRFDFTAGDSTNSLRSYSITNRTGNTATAYAKVSILQSSGDLLVGGSVGIGTSSPATRLHVAGTSSTFNGLLLTTTASGAGSYTSIHAGTYYPTWTVAPPASIRFIDDGNFSSHIAFRTKTSGSASNSDVERLRIDSTGAAWIKTSRAWNDTVPTLNIGNDGDGRLQTRHIWGKAAGGTGTEHLWLQLGNSGYHVQVGNAGQNTNLYVGQDLAVGAYFSGGTAGILGSSGYVYGKRFYNIDAVSTDTGFGLYFNGSTDTAYAIYREAGAWTGTPYPDLRIAFHTGIKIGANATYNGVRFYTDYDMSSQVMSVNNASDGLGATNVYVNNSLQAGSSLRAPIFYDSNDTNFYCDPNGTSRFAALVITGSDLYVGDGVTSSIIRMRDSDEGERQLHCNSNRIGFLNQSGGWGSWCEDDGSWATDFAVYAPIFYDRNNTAYYLDPASTSVLNRVNPVGWDTSGRNYSREWIEFTNHSGLYSSLNAAHFYPSNGSHGSWRIAGTRGGWAGLEFDSTGAGNVSLMMNSGHTGVHNNTYGWQWYWTGGKFYVSTGTYGGGAIYPVVTGDSRNSRGATRLYRNDSDTDYSVQTYWTGARWRLRGYAGDTYHAEAEVSYADSAGNAATVTNGLTTTNYTAYLTPKQGSVNAYASFNGSFNPPTFFGSYNIASVIRATGVHAGTGKFQINLLAGAVTNNTYSVFNAANAGSTFYAQSSITTSSYVIGVQNVSGAGVWATDVSTCITGGN